jgi:hypothetical protein
MIDSQDAGIPTVSKLGNLIPNPYSTVDGNPV